MALKFHKKLTAMLLIITLLICVVPAVSAAVDYKELTPANGKYSLSLTNSDLPASMTLTVGEYMVWVIKGLEDTAVPSESNILYVDQVKVTTAGVLNLASFIPKNIENSSVFISGGTLGGLVKVAEIKNLRAITGNITGALVTANKGQRATVQLGTGDSADFNALYTATVSADGSFNFSNVTNGSYTLKISAPYYLTYYKTDMNISDGTSSIGSYEMWAGDLNSDGSVMALDISSLIVQWGKSGITDSSPTAEIAADINIDGSITGLDISMLIVSFGKSSAMISE